MLRMNENVKSYRDFLIRKKKEDDDLYPWMVTTNANVQVFDDLEHAYEEFRKNSVDNHWDTILDIENDLEKELEGNGKWVRDYAIEEFMVWMAHEQDDVKLIQLNPNDAYEMRRLDDFVTMLIGQKDSAALTDCIRALSKYELPDGIKVKLSRAQKTRGLFNR